MIPPRVETAGPDETESAGAMLAEHLRPGDVVLLVGGLGAGKTTFVKGLAAALGVTDDVTSPTFTLCQTYKGRLTVMHADLWRLDRLAEVLDLALDEGLEEGGVLVAEWGEGAAEIFGDDALMVTFDQPGGETDRSISFEGHGERWADRAAGR